MHVLVHRRRRRSALVTAACATFVLALACRPSRGEGKTPVYLGDFRGEQAVRVGPEFDADWRALQDALAKDPGADEVRAAADRLLAAGPPLELRLWAIQARARHAYARGQDAEAVQITDEALAAAAGQADAPADAISALCLSRVRSMVRSGDPARALVLLDEAPLQRPGVLVPMETAALRSIALDRAGRHPEAIAAYASWRASIEADDAAAAFAERRIAALATSLGPAAALERAKTVEGAAQQCLLAAGGSVPAGEAAPWVQRCKAPPRRIGMLLPRTGPLAALADTQLGAAVVAAELLATARGEPLELLWQDSGSDGASAAEGAAALVARGATVIVGPMGAANVRAARARVGESVRVVTPGEPVGDVGGAAPTLERRIVALCQLAAGQGARKLVVLAPDNGYGNRAVAAAADGAGLGKPKVVRYPETTTSFAPITDPLLKSLGPEVALLVADQSARTELVLRQLARDGKGPGAKGAPVVLATAEGISEAQASVGHDVLAGLFVAPTAAAAGDGVAFAEAFARSEGTAAPDHALLVFRALGLALAGGPPPPAPIVIVRISGGKLVVQAAGTP
ncbi:MAG: ABC transporter substrate-binding protein [Nannocystaceae bacterium]